MDSSQGHILVCDDNPVDTRIIQEVLKRANFTVQTVSSGKDALGALATGRHDLLLIDYEMPGLSGLDVLDKLLSESTLSRRIPVVVLTSHMDQDKRLEFLRRGATDYLTKPFDPLELVIRLENHVQAKRLRSSLIRANKALQKEREKVAALQQGLLPSRLLDHPAMEAAALYLPSGMASGDYYDVIERPSGRLLIVLADVAGHGIPSAMYMATVRATLHAVADSEMSLGEILMHLNRVVKRAVDEYSFVTCYLATLDPSSGWLEQTAAGHHPGLLVRNGMVDQLPLDATYPLGITDALDPPLTTVRLQHGDMVVTYTDGVIDRAGEGGVSFGLEALSAVVEYNAPLGPANIVDETEKALLSFRSSTIEQDDATMLVFQYRGRRPPTSL